MNPYESPRTVSQPREPFDATGTVLSIGVTLLGISIIPLFVASYMEFMGQPESEQMRYWTCFGLLFSPGTFLTFTGFACAFIKESKQRR